MSRKKNPLLLSDEEKRNLNVSWYLKNKQNVNFWDIVQLNNLKYDILREYYRSNEINAYTHFQFIYEFLLFIHDPFKFILINLRLRVDIIHQKVMNDLLTVIYKVPFCLTKK